MLPAILAVNVHAGGAALLTIKIKKITACTSHAGTVRRGLPLAGAALRIRDPHTDEKIATVHKAPGECRAEHPAFYEEEVDIRLHPGTGAGWQAAEASLHAWTE